MISERNITQAIVKYKTALYNFIMDKNPSADDDQLVDILEDAITYDLIKSGFTHHEALQILSQYTDLETAYKFIAFYMKKVDNYSNINELIRVIENEHTFDIEQMEPEDWHNIYNASQQLVNL